MFLAKMIDRLALYDLHRKRSKKNTFPLFHWIRLTGTNSIKQKRLMSPLLFMKREKTIWLDISAMNLSFHPGTLSMIV